MNWETTKLYRAKIGGIIYKDVQFPILYNGSPMFTIARCVENGALGLSFPIFNEKCEHIGDVENNKINFTNTDDYICLDGLSRQSLSEKGSELFF